MNTWHSLLRSTFFAAMFFLSPPGFGDDSNIQTFTDSQGRKVEAEMGGIRGGNVILIRNGNAAQWPIAQLSADDQVYVQTWMKNPPSNPKLVIQLFERIGIGESGVLESKKGPGLPKNIPLIRQTKEKEMYRHYDVDVTNNSGIDALQLRVEYVIYLIDTSRKVVDLSGRESFPLIAAGKRATVTTGAATYVHRKTTSTTLGTNPLGNLTIGSKTTRGTERFGGIWVKVFALNGDLLGERWKLHPEIERLKPAWTGSLPETEEIIPILKSFEKLKKLFENLPDLPADLPKPPVLPKPPGFPKPPGLPGD